jgi:anti-sigma factor RsiW
MTDTGKDEGLGPERTVALESLLANLPGDYARRYAAIAQIRHAFHRHIASLLEEALNEQVTGMPQDTIEERKALTSWINAQVREIGLAVKCPVTKRPAALIVDRQNRDHPDITRFRFALRTEDGRSSHTAASRNLPRLELTEQRPRVESLARGYRGRSSRDLSR